MIGAGVLFGLAFTFKYNAARLRGRWRRGAVAVPAPDVRRPPPDRSPGSRCRRWRSSLIFARRRRAAPAHRRHDSLQPRVLGRDLPEPARRRALPRRRFRSSARASMRCGRSAAQAASCCSPARWARRERLVPVVWVAAACASIAINGSRGLPQYFIQANPGARARGRMGRRPRVEPGCAPARGRRPGSSPCRWRSSSSSPSGA